FDLEACGSSHVDDVLGAGDLENGFPSGPAVLERIEDRGDGGYGGLVAGEQDLVGIAGGEFDPGVRSLRSAGGADDVETVPHLGGLGPFGCRARMAVLIGVEDH